MKETREIIKHSHNNLDSIMSADNRYVQASDYAAQISGFRSAEQMIGTRNRDSKSFISEISDIIDRENNYVFKKKKPIQYLVQAGPYADDHIRIMLVNKTPQYNNESTIENLIICASEVHGAMGNTLFQMMQLTKTISINHPHYQRYDLTLQENELNLKERELEILYYTLRGKSAKQMSPFIYLSPRTVEYYIDNLKDKFNVLSKSQLIEKAIATGYLYILPKRIIQQQSS